MIGYFGVSFFDLDLEVERSWVVSFLRRDDDDDDVVVVVVVVDPDDFFLDLLSSFSDILASESSWCLDEELLLDRVNVFREL